VGAKSPGHTETGGDIKAGPRKTHHRHGSKKERVINPGSTGAAKGGGQV